MLIPSSDEGHGSRRAGIPSAAMSRVFVAWKEDSEGSTTVELESQDRDMALAVISSFLSFSERRPRRVGSRNGLLRPGGFGAVGTGVAILSKFASDL